VTVKLTLAYVGTDPVIANGVTAPSPRRPANAFVLSVATTLPPELRNVAFTVARPTVPPVLLRTSPTMRTAPPPDPAVVRELFTDDFWFVGREADPALRKKAVPLERVDTGDMQVIPVKTFDDALQALQPSDATG